MKKIRQNFGSILPISFVIYLNACDVTVSTLKCKIFRTFLKCTCSPTLKKVLPPLTGVTTGGGKGDAIPRAPDHYGDAEMSQQFHKYFLQYSKFPSGRPQVRTWGRQTCFLPRAPSNLVTPLPPLLFPARGCSIPKKTMRPSSGCCECRPSSANPCNVTNKIM